MVGVQLGMKLFGTTASLVPQAGLNTVANIVPMVIVGVLVNASIQVNTHSIIGSFPGRKAIGDFVIKNVADTVILPKLSKTKSFSLPLL